MLLGRRRPISHKIVCLCGFRILCKPLFEGLRLEERAIRKGYCRALGGRSRAILQSRRRASRVCELILLSELKLTAEISFLAELRDLASRSRRIPNITLSKMMSKPILLGIRYKTNTDGGECEDERALREPREIVVADDMNSYKLFRDIIFVAPQDSGLEGAHALSVLATSG
jgi:hypothetical protein